MGDVVIIKFGGGLITDKSSLRVVKHDVIKRLCEAVAEIVGDCYKVIIVHGAGSFGHLKAKQWRLHEGRIAGMELNSSEIKNQDEACDSVIADMLELNKHVTDGLTSCGVKVAVHPPHLWASNTGPEFKGNIPFSLSSDVVDVSYGDVVRCDGDREFGILSGDDICYRTALEMGVAHMIFAMGGADGVLTCPPSNNNSVLIREWKSGMEFEGVHSSQTDVTGGIHLKLARAEAIAERVDNVWILNGEHPDRISRAIQDGDTIGTRILG